MRNTEETNPNCIQCNVRMNSLFVGLDTAQLSELLKHKSCSSFKKGQYIFSENGLPQGLYCVNSGKIKLSTAGIDGKEQILRLAKAGDLLGYRSLIASERYSSSAVTLEDSSVCIIDKEYFNTAIITNHILLFELLKKISIDLKLAEEQIVSLSQKNVRERMAEALLFLKATYGFTIDCATINVAMSREEIADYVGTSTESAIRLLSEFNQDRIIELSGKKIKILNLPLLIKTANLHD